MKTLDAFEKHLQASSKHGFSSIYVIFCEDPFERRYLAKKLFTFLKHFLPDLVFESKTLGDMDIRSHFQEDLFSISPFSFLDGIDLLSKDDLDLLLSLLKTMQNRTLLIGGSKKVSSFLDAIEKESVILDLSSEKPWEKKRRLLEECQKIVRAHKKEVAFSLLEELYERSNGDFATCKHELDKLFCYVGDKRTISEEDFSAIITTPKEISFWQAAQELVWEGKTKEKPYFKDVKDILTFLGALRYHLYLGIKINDTLQKGGDLALLPLRKGEVEKYPPLAKKRTHAYFISRLLKLFDFELFTKDHTVDIVSLWEELLIRVSS